jgi:hypothetical protein
LEAIILLGVWQGFCRSQWRSTWKSPAKGPLKLFSYIHIYIIFCCLIMLKTYAQKDIHLLKFWPKQGPSTSEFIISTRHVLIRNFLKIVLKLTWEIMTSASGVQRSQTNRLICYTVLLLVELHSIYI